MGRWAFFNTRFEYKFAFASQPSEDIEKFGGWTKHIDVNNRRIRWTAEDKSTILEGVQEIERIHGLAPCNFNLYEKTIRGTESLLEYIYRIEQIDGPVKATYCLGAIIYHQLTYKEPLEASYEL